MKHIFTKALALACMLTVGMQVSANNFTYKGLKYTIVSEDEYTAAVAGVDSVEQNVEIPIDAISEGTPYAVVAVADSAFFGQKDIESVVIPEGVTQIGEYAFAGCEGLTKVSLPESLEKLSKASFYWCSALPSIDLPDSITEIPELCFYWCQSLATCPVTANIRKIDRSAFVATAFKNLPLPEGLEEIGEFAFLFNHSLRTIYIPSTVTVMGDKMFSECESIREIDCALQEPMLFYPDFRSFVRTMAVVYVPTGTTSLYKAIHPWKDFARIKEKDFPNAGVITHCDPIECDYPAADTPMKVYTLSGAEVGNSLEGLDQGLYVVRTADKVYKINI